MKNMFPYAKRYEFYGASELSFVTELVDKGVKQSRIQGGNFVISTSSHVMK